MVETVTKTYRIHTEDVENFKNQLAKWEIEPEYVDEAFKFKVQSNNTIYDITVMDESKLTLEERLFIFNTFKLIHTFDDIQMDIFGKVIWNWK